MEEIKNLERNNKNERKRKYDEDGFEEWGGYMNAKITKLEQQFDDESKKLDPTEKLSDIFKGVAIFVNGYTEPSAEDLRLLMLLHGGVYHHYHRSEKTTHVIASNLPNAKMMQMKTMKVVRPEWIVKSIEAGKLLDYKPFLLFTKQSIFEDGKKEKAEDVKSTLLKGRQHNIAKTAVDSQFITEFYSNSRLHHLSTMGAMFKVYVSDLKEKHGGVFPGRQRIAEWSQKTSGRIFKMISTDKVIMHIDMDCFFVSVALRNHPELAGKPVAVAHARGNPTHQRPGVDSKFEYQFYRHKMDAKLGLKNEDDSTESDEDDISKPWLSEFSSRSEVASCSYEARKAGVRNGMYLGAALKLCPDLKTVPYDFEGYKEVSYTLYNTVAEYTLDIEAVSCDEMFIDCTSLLRDVKIRALDFAEMLRGDIRDRTLCPSSIGIGSNKLQARLATKRAKPDGQFQLQPEDVQLFMSDVDIYDLPGVGRTIGYKLKALNVRNCLDLQGIPLSVLKKECGGKTGEMLYKYSRGIDDRTVNSNHQRKSVSAEVNYGIRFTKEEEAITFFRQLSQEVSNRLKEVNMKGRNITLKVMIRAKDAPIEAAKFLGHGACDYTTRSYHLPAPSCDPELISKHVISMYHQLSIPASELRGIGIQITKLESSKSSKGISKFLQEKKPEPKKAQIAEPEKLQLPPMSQIDRNILNDLPNDLKVAILSEYGLTNSDALIKTDPARNVAEKKSVNAFSGLSMIQMRTMITEWVAAETRPSKFDVDMLIEHFCDLVQRKRIDEVAVLIRCVRRNVTNKGSQVWKECCEDILAHVQSSMMSVFGKCLIIDDP